MRCRCSVIGCGRSRCTRSSTSVCRRSALSGVFSSCEATDRNASRALSAFDSSALTRASSSARAWRSLTAAPRNKPVTAKLATNTCNKAKLADR